MGTGRAWSDIRTLAVLVLPIPLKRGHGVCSFIFLTWKEASADFDFSGVVLSFFFIFLISVVITDFFSQIQTAAEQRARR